MHKAKLIGAFIILSTAQFSFGQTNKEIAIEKTKTAINLMDNGQMDESIKLLEEAVKLDPEGLDYPYEMAYAYYMKEDYKTAIKILEKNKKHKDVNDRLYQLLGNSYDNLGKSDKAMKIYDEGLELFPKSGMLYLEKGNVHWIKKEYEEALPFYEKGIEVDPDFPSNYYRAAKIFCNSSEEVWGMIYGEIFLNLERNTKRTAEISKLLFDTYKSEIKITSDTSMSIGFCKNMVVNIGTDPTNIKLPFCMIYEPTLLMSIGFRKVIDINSLDEIRSNFIDNYFNNKREKLYPNILFSYQKKIKEAGHIEAYNHWVLMMGDEDGFKKWQEQNKKEWDEFVKWINENELVVNDEKKFFRSQY